MVRIQCTEDFKKNPTVIRVIGVGGGGGNAVNRMVEAGLRGVDFIVLNTDAQDLRRNKAPVRIQMGENLTKGLGVGGDPCKGRQSALESAESIKEIIAGSDLIFITAGMGGGTGTGAAPVVAQLARETSALVIGVVTRPFDFEGRPRSAQAETGIKEMRNFVDSLLVIPNDRLFAIIEKETSSHEAYRIADDVLRQAIQGISDVITASGDINVDFADVKKIMAKSGEALIGIGQAEGPNRHLEAAKKAIHSPLLENAVIEGAKGILVNFSANKSITLSELKEGMEYIRRSAVDANIKYGQAYDETLGDALKITVIATGFPSAEGGRRPDAGLTKRNLLSPGRTGIEDFQDEPAERSPARDLRGETDYSRPAYLRTKSTKLK
ncbi:MAG: cell division protein FtsZ [bacterium]